MPRLPSPDHDEACHTPDGNELEIMWMLPREAWGEYEHAAPVDRLDLVGDVARWTGVRTAGQIVQGRPAGDRLPAVGRGDRPGPLTGAWCQPAPPLGTPLRADREESP